MANWLWCIALILFIAWAVLVTRKVDALFAKYSFLAQPEAQHSVKYAPFTRNDYKNWNRKEMIIGGIFLLPLRAVLFFTAMVSGWVGLKILIWIFQVHDLTVEQPIKFIKLSRIVSRIASRVSLFASGIHSISVLTKKYKNVYPNMTCLKDEAVTILVSNHVSYLDIIYYLARPDTPCFIAKAEVKKIPFIGIYAQVLQCIFVDRFSKEARFDVLNLLKERVDKIKAGLNYSKMVIFPEGTTTNGQTCIDLKKGAFVINTPLKLVGLRYGGRFSPSYNLINILDSMLSMMSQFGSDLTVIEMEGVIYPTKHMEWEEFAQNVKEIMTQEFGLQSRSGSFEGKKEFEIMLRRLKNQKA